MRFPWQGPFNSQSGFLAKFNGDGSNLLYSTYLGDARGFSAVGLARQSSGELVLAGDDDEGSVFLNTVSETSPPPPNHGDLGLNEAHKEGGPRAPGEWVTVRGRGFRPASPA